VVPKTHELADIIDLLLPGDAKLARLRRKADSLTQYAVDYRYPGEIATKRQMEAALRHVDQIAWNAAANSNFRRDKLSWHFRRGSLPHGSLAVKTARSAQ
jgi:HEPN domain